MKNRMQIKRYIIYGIIFLLLYIIQTMPQSGLNKGYSTPELLLPLLTVLALFEGEKFGAIFGIIIGLLYDAQGGGLTGFYTILFMFYGYFTGILLIFLLRRNILTSMSISAICVLTTNYLFYFFFYYMYGELSFSYVTLNIILPKTAMSLVFTFFIYLLIRYIYNKFPD